MMRPPDPTSGHDTPAGHDVRHGIHQKPAARIAEGGFFSSGRRHAGRTPDRQLVPKRFTSMKFTAEPLKRAASTRTGSELVKPAA
jgi:hypothetical protein